MVNLELTNKVLKKLEEFKNHPLNINNDPMLINLLAMYVGADIEMVREICINLQKSHIVEIVMSDFVRLI